MLFLRGKNGILWLTGYLIWSFVDYFCVSIIKLKQVVFMRALIFPLDKLTSSTIWTLVSSKIYISPLTRVSSKTSVHTSFTGFSFSGWTGWGRASGEIKHLRIREECSLSFKGGFVLPWCCFCLFCPNSNLQHWNGETVSNRLRPSSPGGHRYCFWPDKVTTSVWSSQIHPHNMEQHTVFTTDILARNSRVNG